jgi:hypothetical protein
MITAKQLASSCDREHLRCTVVVMVSKVEVA